MYCTNMLSTPLQLKDEGNDLLKNGKFEEAAAKYGRALYCMAEAHNDDVELKAICMCALHNRRIFFTSFILNGLLRAQLLFDVEQVSCTERVFFNPSFILNGHILTCLLSATHHSQIGTTTLHSQIDKLSSSPLFHS